MILLQLQKYTIIIVVFVVTFVVAMLIENTISAPSEVESVRGVGHPYPPWALESSENLRAYIANFCRRHNNTQYTLNNPFGTQRCYTFYACDSEVRLSCFSNLYFSYYHQDCVPYTESDCYLDPNLYQ
ncbi:Clas50 [Clostera anastomosis granulovirus B]|uniref:Clas50 n=1 Tax=Clostera anastomosis granulovirus B TaxID=1986290 RepID=A0A0K0WSJ8_9BBAC|nr:Clas50 [Clostera anastomosis granulovirus B]AKS25393.1 Clas50 [Clostera anastomosis granulovirus B]